MLFFLRGKKNYHLVMTTIKIVDKQNSILTLTYTILSKTIMSKMSIQRESKSRYITSREIRQFFKYKRGEYMNNGVQICWRHAFLLNKRYVYTLYCTYHRHNLLSDSFPRGWCFKKEYSRKLWREGEDERGC